MPKATAKKAKTRKPAAKKQKPAKSRSRGAAAKSPTAAGGAAPRAEGPSYWLVKSEPETFSFDDLMARPDQTTFWDGVRNFAARGHMRAMKKGDRVFFYHSNANPSAIVGIAEVAREAYPDSTAFDANDPHYDPKSNPEAPTWFMVDVRGIERLPRPVSLDEIKKVDALASMALVRLGRLSVQPVTPKEWETVLKLARAKPV
ncbi:MAG TPA: EVE domain-containing protein [Gemmatimonadaceae bacterium]|jgi:predicted RNA-binding protein with PUA-like domain|nr:EVE domain-containing protein [Gemmatimonadaceae bacterium]